MVFLASHKVFEDWTRTRKAEMITFDQAYIIGKAFYHGRMEKEWVPLSRQGIKEAFEGAGLTGRFWEVKEH